MNSLVILTLAVLLSSITATFESSVKHPVLLAPGFLASQIDAKYLKQPPNINCGKLNETRVLWLNLMGLLRIDCFLESLKLHYDKKTHTTKDGDFIETSIPGFGRVEQAENYIDPPISYGDYFLGVVDTLEKKGYKRNVEIRSAQYDFRKGLYELDSYFKATIKLIKTMYTQAGNKSVVLIGHSMGNLMINFLLNNAEKKWKEKYIKTFISVSAPYIGSSECVMGILSGTFGRINFLPPSIDQGLLASWPSLYQLLPQAQFWNKEPIVFTKDHGNFTVSQTMDLLKLSKRKNGPEIYKDVLDRINFNHLTNAPNVPIYCIYSVGLKTLKQFDYRNVKFPDEEPTILYGDGDGTVNIESLKHCEQWKNKQKHPVITKIFEKIKHRNILKSKLFLNKFSHIMDAINKST